MNAQVKDHHRDPDGEGVEWGKNKALSQTQQIATLRSEVADLRQEMHELTESVKGLVQAWKAAGLAVAVVKWLAAIGAAIAGIKAGYSALRQP